MEEEDDEFITLKKDKLSCHLPFILKMIEITRGTELENKWQLMHQCITNDRKIMTAAQIYRLDDTVMKVKAEQLEREKSGTETIAEEPIEIKKVQTEVPTPDDLGKPVLTSDDLQELIKELSCADNFESSLKKETKVVEEEPPKRPVAKITLDKNHPMIRLPSSCVPSKVAAPKGNVSTPLSPLLLQKTPKFNVKYRIPKLSPASSTPCKSPAENQKKETPGKLKTIDIFKSNEKKEDFNKLLSPSLWDELHSASPKPKKSDARCELNLGTKANSSPRSSKNDESTTSKDRHQEKVKSKDEATFSKDEKQEKAKSNHETAAKLFRNKAQEERINKELRRLQENIVKDAAPLKPRRSCTLKREGYVESAISDEEESVSQLPKRRKSIVDTKLQSQISHRRKSVVDTKPVVKPPSVSKPSPSNASKLSPVAAEKKNVTESQSTLVRVTRRSHITSSDKSQDDDDVPLAKRLRKSDAIDDLMKPFNLKPCSINLPTKTPDELKRMFSPNRKQVAMKSTNPIPISLLTGMIKRKAPVPFQKVVFKKEKQMRTLMAMKRTAPKSAQPETDSDDGWEDVSDDFDDDEEQNEQQEPTAKPQLIKGAQRKVMSFKTICNIAFNHVESGAIYKCNLPDCKFLTLRSYSFLQHLESNHATQRWTGHCNACAKNVMPAAPDHSIISEFLHLMEAHLIKPKQAQEVFEKAEEKKLPIVETKQDSGLEKEQVSVDKPEVPEEKTVVKTQPIKSPPVVITSAPTKSNAIAQSKGNGIRLGYIWNPKIAVRTSLIPQLEVDDVTLSNIDAILKGLSSDSDGDKAVKKPPPCKFSSQSLNQQTTSIVPVKPKPVPFGGTRVFAKNFVGRVIPAPKNINIVLSPSLLANAKKLVQPLQVKPAVQAPLQTTPVGSRTDDVATLNISKASETSTVQAESSLTLEPLCIRDNVVVRNYNQDQDDDSDYIEILRPWLNKKAIKSQKTITTLTSETALTAEFKCLGSDCSFFTSDHKTFLSHLKFHERFKLADKSNFLSCAYCNFCCGEGSDSTALIAHIREVHKHDRYQCSYCFYRSRVDFNVITHQNYFHKLRPRMIIDLRLNTDRDLEKEMDTVNDNRSRFVPPIKCAFCTSSFYISRNFMTHLQTHKTTTSIKCRVCDDRATTATIHKHLVECHNIGLFQCIYCRFGTNTFEVISNHIANVHPSCLPLFCERSDAQARSDQTPDSIDSVTTKLINQNISHYQKKLAPTNFIRLTNFANVGQLGQNTSVRGIRNSSSENSNANIAPRTDPKANKPPIFSSTADQNKPKVVSKGSADVDSAQSQLKDLHNERFTKVYRHDLAKAPFVTYMDGSTQAQPLYSSPIAFAPERPASPKKSIGLQIQSVFSLSNDSYQNFEN